MEWKVVLTNTGEDSITVIDLANNCEKEKFFLSIDAHVGPWDLTLNNEKNKIYLANAYNDSVFKINIEDMKIEDIMIVGKFPCTIKVYNGFIFVLNKDSNSISIIDEKNFKLVETISVGDKPEDMEIYKLSKNIFVANNNDCSIDIIDLQKNNKDKFKLNKKPIKICLENKFMYVLSHSDESFSNYSNISIISLDNFNIVKSLDIEGIFNNMLKIKQKDILFLTSLQDGHLCKMNFKNGKIIKKFYLSGMPNKIFWDGDKCLFITNILKNTLTIFNLVENKVIKNIKVGEEPGGLIFI